MTTFLLAFQILLAQPQPAVSKKMPAEDVRRDQVMQWAAKPDSKSCESIESALTDPSADIRIRAASALYWKCDRSKVAAHATAALCKSVEMGNASAGALLLLGYAPRAAAEPCLKKPLPRSAMVKSVTSSSPVSASFAAMIALAHLGDTTSLTNLRSAFDHPAVPEALFLLAVLDDIQDPKALQGALQLLDDKREIQGLLSHSTRTMRDAVVEALAKRLQLKHSFIVEPGQRYNDAEVAELRISARKAIETLPKP